MTRRVPLTVNESLTQHINNYLRNQARLYRDTGRGKVRAINGTTCPKMGAEQWTCSYHECRCHRRVYIKADQANVLLPGCSALSIMDGVI